MNETPHPAPHTFHDLAEDVLVKMERVEYTRRLVKEADKELDRVNQSPRANLYRTPADFAKAQRDRGLARRRYYETVDAHSKAQAAADTAELRLAKYLGLPRQSYVRIAYPKAGPRAALFVKRNEEHSATVRLENGPTDEDHAEALNANHARIPER